jgi:hypothetical protein
MIAPLQTKSDHRSRSASPRLVAARAAIASILLRNTETPAPPIRAWKAWLFIVWIGLATVSYALAMSGLFTPNAG